MSAGAGSQTLRAGVKTVLPSSVIHKLMRMRSAVQLRREFSADRKRYARHSLPGEVSGSGVTGRNLEAQLIKDYHRVEKALSLREPRRPFGESLATRIQANMEAARNQGVDIPVVSHAGSAQSGLVEWNRSGKRSDRLAPRASTTARGIHDPEGFFGSRHSVRDFDERHVEPEVLERALTMAVRSPSVCNRQAWLVRFLTGPEARTALAFQNGNAGFGESVPVVALVTVDARLFAAPGERNQPWIEGGIFSMSLVWALHALGLDSCMLNMSVSNNRAAALRQALSIPEGELVIMMIAAGYGREGHRVARSPRRTLDEVAVSLSRPVLATERG